MSGDEATKDEIRNESEEGGDGSPQLSSNIPSLPYPFHMSPVIFHLGRTTSPLSPWAEDLL